MKTRSAGKRKFVESGCGDSSTPTNLDEKSWGNLQHHIDLAENVYSRLPFEEFFRLRGVCKDWYAVACKRLGLNEPIHKPYFTLFTKGGIGQLDGILTYNALHRSWEWKTSWTHNHSFNFVSSDGVVYSAHDVFGASVSKSACAFHWQSKMYQHLAPPPAPPNIDEKMILGMSVSETRSPYSSFRVVCGNQDSDTQVFESGLWQTKPCRIPKPRAGGALQASTGCVTCNERVYITTEHTREIFVYDFKKARWSSLLSPCDWDSKQLTEHHCLDTLGAWNGRVFDVTCDFQSGRRKNWSLQVWELVDETLHKWIVYDCMPKCLCSWLRSARGFHPSRSKTKEVSIQASFCGDFMLVYSWDSGNGSAGRFCLLNMATKNWQKLDISVGTVMVDVVDLSDPYDSENDSLFHYDGYESLDEFRMEDFDDDLDPDFGWILRDIL